MDRYNIFANLDDREVGGMNKIRFVDGDFSMGSNIVRDGRLQVCPKTGSTCGVWCPASHHYPANGIDPEFVELKCFPRSVKFEVGP